MYMYMYRSGYKWSSIRCSAWVKLVHGNSDTCTCTCMFYDVYILHLHVHVYMHVIWLPVIGASWGSEERNGTDCNNWWR